MNSPDLKPLSDLANSSNLLKIDISADNLSAYIPANTEINPRVAEWNFEDLKSFLRRWGFAAEPTQEDFNNLLDRITAEPEGLSENFTILRGTPPSVPKSGKLEWLNLPPIPKDLAVATKPFIKVIQPQPPQPGVSVYGTPISPDVNIKIPDPIELELESGITLTPDGLLISEVSGKIFADTQKVKVEPGYEITDPSLPQYRDAELPCNVVVKGDLVGSLKWKVMGNFHVEGHLSAPNIEVFGDAQIDSGIQTSTSDPNAVLKIYGNLRTTYIQFSKVGVAKDCFVNSSIVQSEVRVGGNLFCKGEPGVVMGSEIACFGGIIANKIGSDKGRRTRISVYRRSPSIKPPRTKIGLLSKDTRMRVHGEVWSQREDATYESPDIA